MPLSQLEKKRVEKILGEYCRNKIPLHVQNQIKLLYTIRGNDVTLIESRPGWKNKELWTKRPIARIRYEDTTLKWHLYWPRANGKWEKYPAFPPTNNLTKIVNEIEKDPHATFWG